MTATTYATAAEIANFLDGLVPDFCPITPDERRGATRGILFGIVEATPVEEGPWIDGPMMLTIRDISRTGICLMGADPLLSKQVVLMLVATSGEELAVLAEVVRSKRTGNVWETACQFVTK